MKYISKIDRIMRSIELTVSSISILISCLVVLYTIIVRNLGLSTGDWALGLPVTMVSCITFFGCGGIVSDDSHIKTVLLVKQFNPNVQKGIYFISYLLLICSSALILYYSITLLVMHYNSNYRLEDLFYIPYFIVFSILPISLILWIFHFIVRIILIFQQNGNRGYL